MDGVLASAKAFKAEAEVVNEKLGANNKKEQPRAINLRLMMLLGSFKVFVLEYQRLDSKQGCEVAFILREPELLDMPGRHAVSKAWGAFTSSYRIPGGESRRHGALAPSPFPHPGFPMSQDADSTQSSVCLFGATAPCHCLTT